MPSISDDVAFLTQYVESHPFWDNSIFRACTQGDFTMAEFRVLFGQYAHYSRNFTRYLAGLMFTCTDDLLRAKLSENLWEEGGGADPGQRHAELHELCVEHSARCVERNAAIHFDQLDQHGLRGREECQHARRQWAGRL